MRPLLMLMLWMLPLVAHAQGVDWIDLTPAPPVEDGPIDVLPPPVPPVPAERPRITLPDEVRGEGLVPVTADTNGQLVEWFPLTAGLQVVPAELLIDSRRTMVFASKPGVYELQAWTALGNVPSKSAITRVVIGDPNPPPPPPVPPGPLPPGPTPSPVPATNGLKVLLVEERDQRNKNMQKLAVLTSRELKLWLTTNCARSADGASGGWRLWDQDADASLVQEEPFWAQLLARPRTELPWVVAVKDGRLVEGPLPDTVAETTKLIQGVLAPAAAPPQAATGSK